MQPRKVDPLRSLLVVLGLCLTFTVLPPFSHIVYPVARQIAFGDAFPLFAAFGNCGRPCRVTFSTGGDVNVFLNAARYAKANNIHAVLDGFCASGCALFADRARSNTCVMPNATIGFHQLWDIMGNHFDPTHSTDIHRWVMRKKGYPLYSVLTMTYVDAVKIWKPCGLQIPKFLR